MSEAPKQPQLTPEQIKQLMSLQQQMAQPQNLSKKALLKQKILSSIGSGIQKLTVKLDRFVNFIVKKQDADRNDVLQASRAPVLFGTYIIVFFVGLGAIWSALAPLDSAAHAQGTVVTTTNKKIIQHNEGGIIKAIYIKQGDHVKEGQVLIALEDTLMKSKQEQALNQYRTYLATEDRLIAERDNLDSIEFDAFLMKDLNLHEVAKIIHTQENLFRSKKDAFRGEKESLKQKILQTHKQIEGLEAKKIAEKKQLEFISGRVKSLIKLVEKGIAQKQTLSEMQYKETAIKSEIIGTESDIIRNNQEITKLEIDALNFQNKTIERTLSELRDVQAQVTSNKEQFIQFTDTLNRIQIKSPVDGIVNWVKYSTIGGVIAPGQQVLEISPINDHLIIEARIPQINIDSVHVGLKAKINFAAFKSRTTPTLTGVVISLSPDTVQDERSQQQSDTYYIARIEIDMEEFNKIAKSKNLKLLPGMQADVQIVTGTRTLLRYMLDPLTDTMFKAFKEK